MWSFHQVRGYFHPNEAYTRRLTADLVMHTRFDNGPKRLGLSRRFPTLLW
jgi:hypothetical protein